jgi:hypothetical protein
MAAVIPRDVLGRDTCESGSLGLSICGYNFSFYQLLSLEAALPKDCRKAAHQVFQREDHVDPLVIYGLLTLTAVPMARSEQEVGERDLEPGCLVRGY